MTLPAPTNPGQAIHAAFLYGSRDQFLSGTGALPWVSCLPAACGKIDGLCRCAGPGQGQWAKQRARGVRSAITSNGTSAGCWPAGS
jgi:hypothetical protein